ncbi:hypothetical protein R1flu_006733 [Riccia fluitans]|uniref:C2H2-type domain-containing protein n=1 Tax=Riccia fluitans TaxID=41844 RepID=A0ABD1YWV5_9MARC
MQHAGQGSEGRHPSSPQAANGSSLPKFSLLGQQLTSYSQQNPASSSNMGFSLGAHPQLQNHQSHSQAFAQAQAMNGGGNGGPIGERSHSNFFQNSGGNAAAPGERNYGNFLQNMSNPPVGGPSFSHSNNQNNAAFMNQLPWQDNMSMPDTSPEAIMSALQLIQQKIGQLQAIVPLLAASSTTPVCNSQPQKPQVAAASTMSMISQLAAAVSSIFPGAPPSPQQSPTVVNQQQQPICNNFTGSRSQQQQLQEIIQHMGDSPPPHAYNFFQQQQQQQGGSSSMGGQQPLASLPNIAMGNSVGNNFPGLQGNNGGNNLSANSISNLGTGLVGNLNGVFGCDAGTAANAASPGQNSRNKEMGVVNSSQMGNSTARNNIVTGPGVRESNGVSRPPPSPPPPHHPVTSSPSQLDDDTSKRRSRDEDDDGEGEKLDPSEYELVEMDAVEILAEHTHFCEICGKGFKRDANLRMHMRGHGDEYKTPAALARPDKAAHDQAAVKERRYSCPYAGCKRNKKHRKFAPLKTMLCVKNHYRRSHCPKMLSCAKCKSKKFSVVADLKTHEKHCGCDKWQCSCGTTFSRKDKLLGHISLFAGHAPAVPLDGDNHRELDSLDLRAGSQQQPSVNESAQYSLPGSSGMGNEMISESGMGHGLQGMHGRLAEGSDVGSDCNFGVTDSQLSCYRNATSFRAEIKELRSYSRLLNSKGSVLTGENDFFSRSDTRFL